MARLSNYFNKSSPDHQQQPLICMQGNSIPCIFMDILDMYQSVIALIKMSELVRVTRVTVISTWCCAEDICRIIGSLSLPNTSEAIDAREGRFVSHFC